MKLQVLRDDEDIRSLRSALRRGDAPSVNHGTDIAVGNDNDSNVDRTFI
jgi:hypothetical protein